MSADPYYNLKMVLYSPKEEIVASRWVRLPKSELTFDNLYNGTFWVGVSSSFQVDGLLKLKELERDAGFAEGIRK